jgi:hypothetical protein
MRTRSTSAKNVLVGFVDSHFPPIERAEHKRIAEFSTIEWRERFEPRLRP